MLIDVANALVDADLPMPVYGPGPPHTPESLTHIGCYMYDVISAVQGGGQSDNTKSLTA